MIDDIVKTLFWTSYRYCIGRHSYVASYAEDMGKYFYDKLTKEEKLHNAEDIRHCISEQLGLYSPFHFKVNYSIRNQDKRTWDLFIEFINSLKDPKELSKITHIEAYEKDGKIEYAVDRRENAEYEMPYYETDLLDLFGWVDLASLLDVECHKTIIPTKDISKRIECFPSWVNTLEEVGEEGIYKTYKSTPFKYKKVWKPVDGRFSQYIDTEDIEAII